MTRKTKNRKKSVTNGQEKLTLDNLNLPSYEKVLRDISMKLGKRPKLSKDLPNGDWTEQSVRVLKERYLRKDEEGRVIETPDEMCWRVAWDIASAEVLWGKSKTEVRKIASEVYELLA